MLRQVRIFTDFLERTLSPEQKAAHGGLAELLNMRASFKAADVEVSEVFRSAIEYHKASFHLIGVPQKVIATNGPLGSLLAAAAGVLKTMPESTLTQAISLVSKRVGQPALASASALWAASLQGQAVSAMASNTDLSGPAMAGG